jgi:NADPH-dependent curcumin reductase CurA
MPDHNIVVRLARLPDPGPLTSEVYAYVEEPLRPLADGEFRIETLYATIDAGTRASIDTESDYVMKLRVGGRIPASGLAGRIIETANPAWPVGAYVALGGAAREKYLTINLDKHRAVKRVDPAATPLTAHLGILGVTSFTAWVGVSKIGKPKAGETLLVSAAAGAVGSAAGQFGAIAGARVVGIAGGAEKCAFVRDVLGFDDCVDYKAGDVAEAIAAACPDGVDVYFENVGGDIQKAAFSHMNDFGRVAMCGMIAQYSGQGPLPGPNLMGVVLKRLRIEGFLAHEHYDDLPAFEAQAAALLAEGRLRHHVTVVEGLENLHEAVNSLVQGRNFGVQIHQMAPDPTR